MIKKFAQKLDYEIPETLQGLVLAFILGETLEPVNLKSPIFATGFPLVVNIFGDKPTMIVNDYECRYDSRLVVAGQIHQAKVEFQIQGIFQQIGVILHPTAPYYLFHKPGFFFNNMWRSFEESSPLEIDELTKNLSSCESIEHRITLILNFLEILEKHRLPPIIWLESAIVKIFEQNGKISQEELIEHSGVGDRHFRRTFKKVVGVPPKYFCKIIQLNTVFELINQKATEKLHHIALDCGYYDQSHFINDFNKMVGHSPENFLNGNYAYIKSYMGRP